MGRTGAAPNVREEPAAGAVVVPLRGATDGVRYLDVSDSLSEVVFQTDPEGNWTYLNRAWTQLSGWSVGETIGTNFLDYVHPDERDATLEMFAAVISGGANFCHHEGRYRTRHGYRWVEVRARLMFDEDGRIVGNAGTLMDISRRKATEEALRLSEQRREQVLAAILRSDEDQRARIAGELHDDTIQVMTAALLELDRLGRRLREGRDENAPSLVDGIRTTLAEAVDRTRRMTFELRPPLLESHGLEPAIADLLEQYAQETGARTALDARVGRHRPAAETLVFRTVQELVANARKHADATLLEVSIADDGGVIRGDVRDDGRGFDIERALDRRIMRLHMGLDTTRERLRLAGGDLEMDSAPGTGARMRFRLPVHPRHAVPARPVA